MLTGYITLIDQNFSAIRMYSLAMVSYHLIKHEYKYQVTRPIRVERMINNYPDIRLDTSGNHVVMH